MHTKPQRNCNFKKFETKLILGWNGPNVNKSRLFVAKSIDRHFGSRKNCFLNQDPQRFLSARLWTELLASPVDLVSGSNMNKHENTLNSKTFYYQTQGSPGAALQTFKTTTTT